jgi:hypothetical protein
MAQAGCREISYGIESLSQDVQRAIRKKLSVKRVPPAFDLTHQAGITSCIMLMVGNQGETRETMRDSAGLASTLQPDRVLINTTKVYPGTYLWDAALEEGVVSPEYFESDPEEKPFDLAPDYTGENAAEELRRLERMLQHRTTFIAAFDGCQHAIEDCQRCPPRTPRPLARLQLQFLMAAWRGESSVLGGGDSLTHPNLLELLAFGKVRGVHHLSLQTSARSLSRELRHELASMIDRLLVPIFAIHERHHDGRVGQPGALRETRKGMLSWTRDSGRVTALGFIDRWNTSSLPRWPAWLKQHGVDRLVLCFGESPSGWDRIPAEDLPSLTEAGRELRRTAIEAAAHEIELSVSGLPECVLGIDDEAPESYELGRPFDESLDADGAPIPRARSRREGKSYVAVCDDCTVRSACEGIWNSYLALHGDREVRAERAGRRLAVVAS